jgi:glycosyltransferase AglD
MAFEQGQARLRTNVNIKTWAFRIFTFLLGLGILLSLIFYTGISTFIDILYRANIAYIVLAVIVYALSWVFRTWRLEQLTRHAGKSLSLFEIFKIQISGYALNVVLPAKLGDVIMIGYLKLKGITLGKSTAIVLQSRILDMMAILLISISAILVISSGSTPSWIWMSILIGAIIIAIPTCVAITDKNGLVISIIEKFGSCIRHGFVTLAVSKIKDVYRSYQEIMNDRRLLLYTILLSLFIWTIDGLTCYVLTVSIDNPVQIIVCILAVMTANIGKSVPTTPGSIGIYESILATVLTLFGLPFSIAITIAILDHLIKNIFTLVLGIPGTMNLGLTDEKLKI